MKNLLRFACLGFTTALVSAAPAPAPSPSSAATPAKEAVPAKIKVLIVDGFSNHDWALTTRLIKEIIEPTGLFDVAVSTCPARPTVEGWAEWCPKFKDYDVVIQNTNDINNSGAPWPKPAQTAFEDYVRDGGGVYIWHSAQNAFANWEEYNKIIGLGWRPKTYGTAISIDAEEKLVRIPPGEGSNTSHGARGDVVIHLLGEHPIHQGMPKTWKTPGLEVYYDARGPAENVEVLSYGRDPRFGANWPIEWTVTYGKGRVYVATFGHVWKGDVDPESMRCAGVQTNVVRALQWLAKRPVTFPIPKDFPTETQISVRPPAAKPAEVKPAETPAASVPVKS